MAGIRLDLDASKYRHAVSTGKVRIVALKVEAAVLSQNETVDTGIPFASVSELIADTLRPMRRRHLNHQLNAYGDRGSTELPHL